MDLLKLLKEKAEYFSSSEDDRGISNVVSHIEIAERHYENGKTGDDYLFNDVIYRSNQAFEGALKEAYRVITGEIPNNISPYAIEQYFEKNNILKEKVLTLFTNYRKEWRNESTHNYKLYFSEQEAFLAIVNISAFINILLDQMVEKQAYDKEAENLKKSSVERNLGSIRKTLNDRIIALLLSFSKEIPSDKVLGATEPRITEAALIGSLNAFVNNLAEDISIYPDFLIERENDERKYRADFFLQQGEDKLIIEVKNSIHNTSQILNRGTEQLLNYLTYSGIAHGILYIPPTSENEEMEVFDLIKEVYGVQYSLVQIFPKKRVNK